MGVTSRDVRHVAALARLRLDDEEVESLTRELNGILEHVDALGAVDVSAAAAGDTQATPAPLRADEPGEDALAFDPEALAPSWEGGLFTVPRLASHDEEELPSDAGPGSAP